MIRRKGWALKSQGVKRESLGTVARQRRIKHVLAQEISYVREEVPGKDGFTCQTCLHANLAPISTVSHHIQGSGAAIRT